MMPPSCRSTSRSSNLHPPEPATEHHVVYYLRAHGRTWKKCWHHEHKDERYDYLYKPAEIQAFGETLKAVKKIVRKAYGYMNNQADAKSVANAIELKHFLGEPVPEPALGAAEAIPGAEADGASEDHAECVDAGAQTVVIGTLPIVSMNCHVFDVSGLGCSDGATH